MSLTKANYYNQFQWVVRDWVNALVYSAPIAIEYCNALKGINHFVRSQKSHSHVKQIS